MKKTLSILILILIMGAITISLCFAQDPTAEEILQKVAENYGKIEDLVADVVSTTTAQEIGQPSQILTSFVGKYYQKKPDKIKVEDLEGKYAMVINGEEIYNKDPYTGVTKINSATLGDISISQQNIGYNLDEFKTKHNCIIKSKETEEIYIIETLPIVPNKVYGRLVLKIDYNKGTVITQEIYNPDDSLYQRQTNNYVLINSMWVPNYVENEEIRVDGKIKRISNYKNIQINTGLGDSLFVIFP